MCDEALATLRRYLPCNPEIAAAIATITLQLQFLSSKGDESKQKTTENTQSNTVAFTRLLAELDIVAASVALTYTLPGSPIPCNECGDSIHHFPCPFLFERK